MLSNCLGVFAQLPLYGLRPSQHSCSHLHKLNFLQCKGSKSQFTTHLLQSSLLHRFQQLPTHRLHRSLQQSRKSQTRGLQMTPPCRSFPASELPERIQQDASGRRRKVEGAGSVSRKIDLSACELLQMLQYKCEVERPLSRDSPVRCYAVDRLFRR